jgi:hypothetical protein
MKEAASPLCAAPKAHQRFTGSAFDLLIFFSSLSFFGSL